MSEHATQEPTIEQMENVAVALGFESILHARRAPHYRESLLNLHRLVQRMLNGDQQAEATLERLRHAFGRQT